jgi:hypothetical protein
MTVKAFRLFSTLASVGVLGASLAYSPVSQAFNFGDMMNPGKWMGGGNRDRYYDDDYGPYGGPYGGPWGGGPGYCGGPWGGGPYGYGAPWGGYGPYGGYPRPAAPAAPAAGPQPKSSSSSSSSSSNVRDAQIDALKRRIDELEAKQQSVPPAPPPSDWGSNSSQQYRDWTMGSGPRKSGSGSSGSGSSNNWNSAPVFRPLGKY